MAKHGLARPGLAKPGQAWLGLAGPGQAGPRPAGQQAADAFHGPGRPPAHGVEHRGVVPGAGEDDGPGTAHEAGADGLADIEIVATIVGGRVYPLG